MLVPKSQSNISKRIADNARRAIEEAGLDNPAANNSVDISGSEPRPRLNKGNTGAALRNILEVPFEDEPIPNIPLPSGPQVQVPDSQQPETRAGLVDNDRGLGKRVVDEGRRSFLIRDRDQLLSLIKNIEDNESRGRNSVLLPGRTGTNAPTVVADFSGNIDETTQLQTKRDLARQVVDLTAEAEGIPRSEALQRFQNAEDLGGLFAAIGSNPSVLLESSAGSFAQSLPALAFTAVGSVAGPAGAAVGSFLGSMTVEEQASFAQFLQEEGVDLQNPDALLTAIADDEVRDRLQGQARRKGLGVAVTEGIFSGGVGRLISSSGLGKVGKEVAGTTIDVVGEGAGEAAGSFLATGEASLVESARESLSSVPQSAGTTAGQLAGDAVRQGVTPSREQDVQGDGTGVQETETDVQTQLPSPELFTTEGSADFTFAGVEFSNPQVNLDEAGNPVSVTATDPDGTSRTINDPELATDVLNRIEDVTRVEEDVDPIDGTATEGAEQTGEEIEVPEEQEINEGETEDVQTVEEIVDQESEEVGSDRQENIEEEFVDVFNSVSETITEVENNQSEENALAIIRYISDNEAPDDATIESIKEDFSPVRDELRNIHGDSVTLYRNQSEGTDIGRLVSFTSNPNVSRNFREGGDVIEIEIPVDNIVATGASVDSEFIVENVEDLIKDAVRKSRATDVEKSIDSFEEQFASTPNLQVEGNDIVLDGQPMSITSIELNSNQNPTRVLVDTETGPSEITDPELVASIALEAEVLDDIRPEDIQNDINDFINENLQENDRVIAEGIIDSFEGRFEDVTSAVADGREVSRQDIDFVRETILDNIESSQDLQNQEVARALQLELLTLNRSLDNARIGVIDVATDTELREEVDRISSDIRDIVGENPVIEGFIDEGFDGVADIFFDRVNRGEFNNIPRDMIDSVQRQLDNIREGIPGLPDEFSNGLNEFVELIQGEINAVNERIIAETPDEASLQDGDVETVSEIEGDETGVGENSGETQGDRESRSGESIERGGREGFEQDEPGQEESRNQEVVEETVSDNEGEVPSETRRSVDPVNLREQRPAPGRVPRSDVKGNTFTSPQITPDTTPRVSSTKEGVEEALDATGLRDISEQMDVEITVIDDHFQASALGVDPTDIHFIDSEGREVSTPAFYLETEDRVVFVASAIDGEDTNNDVLSLFMEEVVAHQGLRRLLGDEFESELVSIYDTLDIDILSDSIDVYSDQLRDTNGNTVTKKDVLNGKVKLDDKSKSILVEEYLGDVAQEDPSIVVGQKKVAFQRVLDFIKRVLRRLGVDINPDSIVDEARNLLMLSAENLRLQNNVNPDDVRRATSRLRQAAEVNRNRSTAVKLFTDTITEAEKLEVLNRIIPERLATMLRELGVSFTPESTLDILNLVDGLLPSEVTTPTEDISSNERITEDDVVAENAAQEISDGANTVSSLSGVADVNVPMTQDKKVETFQKGVVRILTERRENVVGSTPSSDNDARINFGPSINVSSDDIVSPISININGDGLAGSKIRSVQASYPVKDGWRPLSPPVIVSDGNIDFRPTPHSFQRADTRGLESDDVVSEWTEELARRINNEDIPRQSREIANWYRSIAAVMDNDFGPIGRRFLEVLIQSSPDVLPTYMTARDVSNAFRRFITGEFDGELVEYKKYLDYVSHQNTLTSLRNQLSAAKEKLKELETARQVGVPSELRRLEEESIRVGGFDELVISLEDGIIDMVNRRAHQSHVIDSNGNYAGPLIGNRQTIPLMSAMVNMYNGVGQEQGGNRNIGYDGGDPTLWKARALQRLAGDPRIPPPSEGRVSDVQRNFIDNVIDQDTMDTLWINEMLMWREKGWVQTTQYPEGSVHPNDNIVKTDKDVVSVGIEEFNVLVEDDTTPLNTAFDAILQAEQNGLDHVVVTRKVENVNTNARPGLTVTFRSPVTLEEAKDFIERAGLPKVQFTGTESEKQQGSVSGFTFTFLPELNKDADALVKDGTTKVDEVITTSFDIVERAVIGLDKIDGPVQIRTLEAELHDPLVIHKNDYGTEKERIKTLIQESVDETVDPKTRRGGEWGIAAGKSVERFVNARDRQPNPSSVATDIGRQAKNKDNHKDVMRTILETMGFDSVSFTDDVTNVYKSLATTVGWVPGKQSVKNVRDALVSEAKVQGIDISFEPSPTGHVINSPKLNDKAAQTLFDIISVADILADGQTPNFSNPVLQANAKINVMRGIIESLTETELKSRPFSRLYRILMAQELGRIMGVSQDVVQGMSFKVRGKKAETVLNEAVMLYDGALPELNGHVDPRNIRFSRRVSESKYDKTLWNDQGTQRRTPKDANTIDLTTHNGYNPEASATTQRSHTEKTYRRIVELIPPGSRVLDFGGGLGAGTQVLRDNGFETTLYEPFPNESGRQVTNPDFIELEDVPEGFDFVVSNFVLNVVPQDTRDLIVRSIGQRLNEGGEALITVRTLKGDVNKSFDNPDNTVLGNGQVLIGSTGAYQKGFEPGELATYLQDVLGPAYAVVREKVGNAEGARITKLNELYPGSALRGDHAPLPNDIVDLDGPPTFVGNSIFGSDIPIGIVNFIMDVKDVFGITRDFYVVTPSSSSQVAGATDNSSVSFEVEDAVATSVENKYQGLHRIRSGINGHLIVLNPSLYADGNINSFTTAEIIVHEIGHAVNKYVDPVEGGLVSVHGKWKDSLDDLSLREAVVSIRLPGVSRRSLSLKIDNFRKQGISETDIEGFLNQSFSDYRKFNPEAYNYLTSFNEWFADEFAKWTTSDLNTRRAFQGREAFEKVGDDMRTLYDLAEEGGFNANGTYSEFITRMVETKSIPDEVSQDEFVNPRNIRFARRFVRSPGDPANFRKRAKDAIIGRKLPTGRPDLANPGFTVKERRFVDLVDEIRNERSEPETIRINQIKPETIRELDADFDNIKKRLLEDGIGSGTDILKDQLMAQEIVHRTLRDVQPDDRQSVMDAMATINSYRELRGGFARALAAGYDPTLTPEERNRRFVETALLTLPKGLRKRMDKAKTKKDRDAVMNEAMKRYENIRDTLAAQGINVLDLTVLQLRNPSFMANIFRTIAADNASVGDKVYEYWINAILSAPTTHVANWTGNIGNAVWDFYLKRPIEAFLNALPVVGNKNDPNAATFGEIREFSRALAGAYGPIWSTAIRRANLAWDMEAPVLENEIGQTGGVKLDRISTAIAGKKGRVIRTSTRFLMWSDEFFKSVIYHVQAAALAYRNAKAQGLSGNELRSRISHVLSNPHATEFTELYEASYAKARNLSFQDPIDNAILRAIQSTNPGDGIISFATAMFFPFTSTPTNILKQGIKRSPLGNLMILKKGIGQIRYLRDPSKTHLRYDANDFTSDVAEQIAISGIILGLSALIGDDEDDPWITGTQADFITERGLLENERRAIPSLSIRIPFSKYYFSYARIEPFATSLALLVDGMTEIQHNRDKGMNTPVAVIESTPILIDTLRGLVKDKSFFQGMSNMLDLAFGTGNKVMNFTANTAASFSPNIIRRGIGAMDPVYRDSKIRGEGLEKYRQLAQRTGQKAFPVIAFAQAPKPDLWGREIRKTPFENPAMNFLTDFLSPGRMASRDRILPVDRMMRNYHIKHPDSERELALPVAPTDKITYAGREIQLNDDQYNEYVTMSGQIAYSMIKNYPFNIDNPTNRDMEVVRKSYTQAKKIAKARLISEMMARGEFSLSGN